MIAVCELMSSYICKYTLFQIVFHMNVCKYLKDV